MKQEFELNAELYSEKIIAQTITDFKEVGEITFKNGILSITGESKEEIIEVFNEFINYATGLINE